MIIQSVFRNYGLQNYSQYQDSGDVAQHSQYV